MERRPGQAYVAEIPDPKYGWSYKSPRSTTPSYWEQINIVGLVVKIQSLAFVMLPPIVGVQALVNMDAFMKRISDSDFSKVPEITLAFWIIKIAATTLGETGGDAVSMSMQLGYLVGTAIFAALFTIAVFVQISAK